MTTLTPTAARSGVRIAPLTGGLLALAAAIAVAVVGSGWSVAALVAMLLAPDVPLLFGMGHGIERGRLAPRAVPYYNAVHRLVGPVFLVSVAVVMAVVSTPQWTLVAASLAWLAHVMVDRGVGYGLRGKDGWQRG
jgi:amino acid transporter